MWLNICLDLEPRENFEKPKICLSMEKILNKLRIFLTDTTQYLFESLPNARKFYNYFFLYIFFISFYVKIFIQSFFSIFFFFYLRWTKKDYLWRDQRGNKTSDQYKLLLYIKLLLAAKIVFRYWQTKGHMFSLYAYSLN